MVNFFIYAKDYSGSTERVPYYHENGLETLKQFKSNVDKIKSELTDSEECRIIYLHWGHVCVEVDEETTVEHYKNQHGSDSDTLPETIIMWIKQNIGVNNKIKLLYIITDGQIEYSSVNKCLHLNEDIDYEDVVFHGINEHKRYIDLSVAVSFFKNRFTIYRNAEKLDEININDEFDYDKITTDNYTTEKDNLTSYIRYKFINKSKSNATALTEIEKLKRLRNRLFAQLPLKKETKLETTDKNTFISEFKNTSWYKNLYTQSYDLKIDIEKTVSTLINYIVYEKKSYAFDALKFDTKFSYKIPEEVITDVKFSTDQEIEFPDIILDDEKGIPVIICTQFNLLDKIIFGKSASTASFSKFNSTMDCPLFLLNDPDLNDSVSYFYTLNVYKQLKENNTKLEPRTLRPFHGGLVLVDTDDFDKYNDYILSATYFNFKKVKYNAGLFYFVLWKMCEKKQWMDKNVVERFRKYMLRRVCSTQCRIGLSSLPLDPQTITSLPTALWYCVEISSDIFKHDPEHFIQERLRMYHSVANSMIEILKYLQYNLDLESIDKRIDLISHVMILKKIPTWREKVYYLLDKIFKSKNGFLVGEIENQSNVQKLNYLKLNHKEMFNDDIIKEEVNLNDHVHLMYYVNDSKVPICDKTLRPFFVLDKNTSFYSAFHKTAKKVVIKKIADKIVLDYIQIDDLEFSRMFSLYNLFLHCVKRYGKFPTLNEYMDYILRRKKFKEDLVTIFSVNVSKDIEDVFLAYQRVIEGVNVSEIVKVYDMYVNRNVRIKAENNLFETDNEINEFIVKEECKVNLKKVIN